jgi:hypothetical protein
MRSSRSIARGIHVPAFVVHEQATLDVTRIRRWAALMRRHEGAALSLGSFSGSAFPRVMRWKSSVI